jgi:hypothetical protein
VYVQVKRYFHWQIVLEKGAVTVEAAVPTCLASLGIKTKNTFFFAVAPVMVPKEPM